MYTTNSSSAKTGEYYWNFNYTPDMEASAIGSINQNGTQGASQNDIKNQNVNQGGFWSGILNAAFVPQHENIDLLKAQVNRVTTWGPLGIITALRDEISTANGPGFQGGPQGYTPYVLQIDGPYGMMYFDLRPYKGYVLWSRGIMAGSIWYIVTFAFWKRVVQRA